MKNLRWMIIVLVVLIASSFYFVYHHMDKVYSHLDVKIIPPIEGFDPLHKIDVYQNALDVIWCEDSTLVLAGGICKNRYEENETTKILVMKVDLTGNIIWRSEIDFGMFAHGTDIKMTESGDLLIAGSSHSNKKIIVLASVSTSGEINWQKTLDSHECDWNRGLFKISDGGYLLTYAQLGTNYPVFTNIDEQGNIIDEKVVKSDNPGMMEDVEIFNNDDMLIRSRGICTGNDTTNVNISRVNNEGEILWNISFIAEYQNPKKMKIMPNGSIMVLLSSYPKNRHTYEIMIFDPNGKEISSSILNYKGVMSINDLLVTKSNDIYLTNYFVPDESGESPLLTKFNQEFKPQWIWHLSNRKKSYVYDLRMNESGDLYGLGEINYKQAILYIPHEKLFL